MNAAPRYALAVWVAGGWVVLYWLRWELNQLLAGEELLARLEPAARERVGGWVLELAQQVEHSIWKQIVRFTRKDGRSMVKEGRVSSDESWKATENYAHKAAHIAQLLLEDYERELVAERG